MGKFRQFLTELSDRDMSIFSFPDNNLSKYHWIFTKLSLCIDIVEILLIQMAKFYQFFDRVICPRHVRLFVSGQ